MVKIAWFQRLTNSHRTVVGALHVSIMTSAHARTSHFLDVARHTIIIAPTVLALLIGPRGPDFGGHTNSGQPPDCGFATVCSLLEAGKFQ